LGGKNITQKLKKRAETRKEKAEVGIKRSLSWPKDQGTPGDGGGKFKKRIYFPTKKTLGGHGRVLLDFSGEKA